jgi:hypothetical protein
MFCRPLFVLLFVFFWPLGCLFFFDIRILIIRWVSSNSSYNHNLGRRGHDRMVVVFTTIYSIDAYHYTRCDFQSSSGEVYSVQHYVIKLSVTCSRSVVFASTPLSSINKTECDDTTEMLLNVALSFIILALTITIWSFLIHDLSPGL